MGNSLITLNLKEQLTEENTSLKHWKEFFEALDIGDKSYWNEDAPLLLERFWTWKEEWGDLKEYWKTFYKQITEKEDEFEKAFLPFLKYFIKKKKEFNNLKSKIKDLENSLLTLAKQKLKGKNQAQTLLTQLETNWKAKEQTWKKDIQQKEQTIIGLNNSYNKLEKQKNQKEIELTTNIQELKDNKKNLENSLQLHQTKIKDLEVQLTSLSHQKITTQQTLNRTHQELTQTQTHYETRKNQALFVGIIGLALILYLTWPLTNKEKESPRTWTYV